MAPVRIEISVRFRMSGVGAMFCKKLKLVLLVRNSDSLL
jgi:hypothetical protein